jgi:ubiquinone/menaquinone biosynthesis C-methylase UbiE
VSISHTQARKFYDDLGSWQDYQVYERAAINRLLSRGEFESTDSLFEFGCGTGRLAEQLLLHYLPTHASYEGVDISQIMIGISQQRLAGFQDRCKLSQSDGKVILRREDASCNRFVSCYVLDLLAEDEIGELLSEANRILAPGGTLCLISLTHGETTIGKWVEQSWSFLYRRRATLVGGCRPIRLRQYVRGPDWRNIRSEVITSWGVSSEVLIADK